MARVCCGVLVLCVLSGVSIVSGCGQDARLSDNEGSAVVLADTTFLADIAQNVAGDRLEVAAVLPMGSDPHSFEPTPQDARRIVDSRVVIINARGLVPQLDDLIAGVGGRELRVIEAAAGIAGVADDPHVWLDPLMVVTYARNIAEGLAAADPDGAGDYNSNAEEYSEELRELDAWIRTRVDGIPVERRLLVTNHESFAYFAKEYGFRIVGTVFPTVAGEGSPSAHQVAALIAEIKTSGAPAIFLETGSSPDLAVQVARETGVEVVDDLHVASLGDNASTYIEMMRWNVDRIMEALE